MIVDVILYLMNINESFLIFPQIYCTFIIIFKMHRTD